MVGIEFHMMVCVLFQWVCVSDPATLNTIHHHHHNNNNNKKITPRHPTPAGWASMAHPTACKYLQNPAVITFP